MHREIGTGQPPSVTYSVTELTRSAAAALAPLLDWIRVNAAAITARSEKDDAVDGHRP
ncbi:hypothetical protein [Streptomyces sp. NPDC046805]|uniref:hypothetical protein n=1 Tax=Streptomyces sp. NPDC046805 TaxID=3155134 RepID=UPI0034011F93